MDRSAERDEEDLRKMYHSQESISSPSTLRAKGEHFHTTTLNMRPLLPQRHRSQSKPISIDTTDYVKRRPPAFPGRQNSPSNQTENFSDNLRHALHLHLNHEGHQQQDDMESYLKAWARLQLNEMHSGTIKSGSKSGNRSRTNSQNER